MTEITESSLTYLLLIQIFENFFLKKFLNKFFSDKYFPRI